MVRSVQVRVYMSLHREATELMNLESAWSPELFETEDAVDNSQQSRMDLANLRGNVDLFYRYSYSLMYILVETLL